MFARGPQRVVLLVLAAVATSAPAADLLIQNARLIDATGAPPRAPVSILVRDGAIHDIAPTIPAPADATIIDAAGHTVIPGLIDAHVHLFSVPGSTFRGDTEDEKRARRATHLRAYLASGVTSVLDTGIGLAHLAEIRALLASGAPGPRVHALGPPLSAPGGYADDRPASYSFHVNVPNAADAEPLIAALAEADLVGIKVKIEHGFGPTKVWPIHPPEIRDAITEAAAAHDLPVYVHAFSEEEQTIAVEMGAHALVHAGFMTGAPSDEHVQRLADAGLWVISTLSIGDAGRVGLHPEILDQPHFQLTVPEAERATAADPAAGQALMDEYTDLMKPWWLPGWLASTILAVFPSLGEITPRHTANAIERFHAAGVPIVMGSDSGNWEIIPYELHGPTSVREVELLTEAGLTPFEAIEASTRVPAEMIGVADRIGTVEVGKRADLVILAEDPLADLTALTRPRWVVKDGEARTPAEWMRD